MDFVIDGSNVLLGLRLKRVPSVRALARLLAALDAANKSYRVWFDNSTRGHLATHREELELFNALLKTLQGAKLVQMAPHADSGIQRDCKEFGCPVINSSDNNDSWPFQPKIYRCRFGRNREQLYVAPAHSPKRIVEVSLVESFDYRGLNFPATQAQATDEGAVVSVPSVRQPIQQNGNLLVLALDASQSMDQTDTYDGRSRAAHVNDILRKSIEELYKSTIRNSLYIAVLVFSSDVVTITPESKGPTFAPVKDWSKWVTTWAGSYESVVPRAQTNIRLTLDRASDFLDQFRSSDEAPLLARRWTSAAVVTLTDGAHFLGEPEHAETSKDILGHVFHTLNRSENIQFAFVGIGADADDASMTAWASEATERQSQLAQRKNIELINSRLYVKVNNNDVNIGGIIRSFVDIVSGASGQR